MTTTKTTKQSNIIGGDATVDTSTSVDQASLAASALQKPINGTSIPKVNVKLDQWADGPVSEGDLDGGAGRTQEEVFVNGNLNAQKAHYNEGDAIPYRAILDDLTPGVVYGVEIQWDTVDSGAYALDYLTGYNFSFENDRHPGEPDVTPKAGIGDLSSGTEYQVAIPGDTQLLAGFGDQFGVTDGLGSDKPSGQQYISIFGNVDSTTLHTSGITYNADLTKASITVYFTYTGSATDTEDSIVLAWGGHIASSADWRDDPGETVETASDISGSPYHMRLLSLYQNDVKTSIGNQDRSLSADAVESVVPDIQLLSIAVDEDFLAAGNQDLPVPSAGDDTGTASQNGNFPVNFGADFNGATISFSALHGLNVIETNGTTDPGDDTQVKISNGDAGLKYFWDAGTHTLYGATDVTSAATATSTAAFKLVVTNPTSTDPVAKYAFTLLQALEHAPGTGVTDNTENPNIFIKLDYLATDSTGDQATGTIDITVDDDIPIRKAGATPIEGSVEEDGMSAAGTDAGGLDGLDRSEGNRDASGDSTTDDQTASTTGTSLAALVSVGADEPPAFSLSETTTGLPLLYSKGILVDYSVSHVAPTQTTQGYDLLTATAGTGTDQRTVFTLQVNQDGTWAFDLDDQLDHVAGSGENYSLRSGATGTSSVDSIDFSSIIQVTDADGDTLAPLTANDFSVKVQDDIPLPLDPGDLQVWNKASESASASLGYSGKVGADEPGSVQFVGADGTVLQGTIQDSTPTAENLKSGGSNIYLFGFGTDTLTATTDSDASDGLDSTKTVFQMTLDPGADTYSISLSKPIDALVDVEFGNVVARVPSGNPDSLIVDNIGGSTIDALFTGFDTSGITTVNVSGAGVGVGNGQDFNNGDRMRIEFLEDDGDGILETGEAETVNRFTFVMNQNNPPADDGDALIRVYDQSGQEVQITGILVNGQTLGLTGTGSVPSNDGGSVTATANGMGFELHGLGGGTSGSTADNDTITIITTSGYSRIDISGIGTDTNKDTFDILLKSVAVPTPFDITFAVQADLTDEDGDGTTPANLDVTLDADGVFSSLALLGVSPTQQDLIT